MKRIRTLPILTLALLFGATSVALAAPLPVSNASFEGSGLDSGGWSNDLPPAEVADSGTGWIGRAGPNDGGTFVESIDGFSADGTHHLGMQNNYYVFQNTGVPWEASTTYTLTVGIGNRNEAFSPEGSLAIIGLTNLVDAPSQDNRLDDVTANDYLDTDPWLAVASASVPSPTEGSTFEDATVTFTTGPTPPSGNVVIFLGDDVTDGRAHFDNVRLDAASTGDGGGLPTPVAHFPLDENGNSVEAGGFVASTVTDVQFGQPGANANTGASASFNGDTSVIQHDWNAGLNPESFTLALWAKSDGGGAGGWNSPVTSRHDLNNEGAASQGYLIYDADGSGIWTFWSGNGPDDGNWQTLDGPEVMVGEWQHIAISYDDAAEVKKLYVDGELVAEANDSLFPNDTTPFNIGSGQDLGDGFRFIGNIDDIGLWDVALSDNDILLAMESGVKAFFGGGGEVNPLDPDGDGIFTPLELKHGLDPNVADADSDNDGDGVIASVEIFELGTLANDPDFDDDGLNDGVETNTGTFVDGTNTGTDPKNADTDKDGLPDGVETNSGTFVSAADPGTNPLINDTDGDGITDGKEVLAGFNPLDGTSAPSFPVPIAYWPFDDQGSSETADLGPAGIISTVNGDPEWVAGHSGMPGDSAIKFDGVDDSVTTEVSLLNDLPNLTMSLWVRMEEEQLGNRIGLVGQNDAVEYGMINPTTMQWWSPAGAFDAEFGPIVEEWTHVAVVLDDVGYTVYANGEVLGGAEGGGPVNSADSLNIGGDGVFDNEGNFFLGEIDDVAIWDEALSEGQIADLASGAVCPLGACGGASFQVNQVARNNATGEVELSWSSFAGNYFDIEASSDLSSGSWQVVANDVPAAGDEAVETSATVQGSTEAAMEYLRVVQVPAPPLLETGFEEGIGEWVSSGAGTLWEFGTPTNGPGAAKTGTGAAAVGLTANYADGTQAILQTPVIDPSSVSGSLKLDFAYFLESSNEEGGQLSILEADGTQIQTLEPLFIGGEDGDTADWTDISIRLPKLDPVRPFIIQFTFLSLEDGEENNGAGFFIDDVRVGK